MSKSVETHINEYNLGERKEKQSYEKNQNTSKRKNVELALKSSQL